MTKSIPGDASAPTASRGKKPKLNLIENIKLMFAYREKGRVDITFLVLVFILLTVGLLMMFSASFVSALYNTSHNDSLYYIKRQGLFAIVGVVAMFAVSAIDYRVIRRLTVPIAVVTYGLLIVVTILPATDGVHRWIPIGFGASIQPSEVAKFTIVILLAHFIAKTPDRMNEWKFIAFLGFIILTFVGMLMLEKHLSGTILMMAIGMCMLYAGGMLNKYKGILFLMIAAGLLVVGLLIFLINKYPQINEHAYIRVYSWIHKDFEPLGARWQTNNSLYAIGSGGLLGTGLGQSMQKYLYVSEPQNDFIFAIVCEELGFVGASAILAVFCLLIYRGVKIAQYAKSNYASLITMGIVFQVGIQVLLNVAVVTDSIPNTGISLPFFSYGGTSLVMLLAEMGVVLSVSRTARLEKIN